VSFHARKFGQVLRELREARGLSQEQLGAKAGVHRTYIGKVERGEKEISLRTATKIAGALGTKLSLIIDALEKRGGKGK
jgi:transcriptional regulator with XRE-family HTH domain